MLTWPACLTAPGCRLTQARARQQTGRQNAAVPGRARSRQAAGDFGKDNSLPLLSLTTHAHCRSVPGWLSVGRAPGWLSVGPERPRLSHMSWPSAGYAVRAPLRRPGPPGPRIKVQMSPSSAAAAGARPLQLRLAAAAALLTVTVLCAAHDRSLTVPGGSARAWLARRA